MAVRLMTYIGLLYQDLIRTGQILKNNKLPPVLPLVLYNGQQTWSGVTAIEELIEEVPGGLTKYRPTLSYLLLDESRHQLQGVSANNLVAAIFRLERSNEIDDVRQLVQELIDWLKAPEQSSLRRAFAVWIRRVLLPVRLPGQKLEKVNDLNEVDAMLAERVKEWTYEWKQEGLEEGIQQGRQQGRQEGRQEGEVDILLRLMKLKFGKLDAAIVSRVEKASEKQLLVWSERILSAEKLEDIFK